MPDETTTRKFFWSARTLRADTLDADGNVVRTEDCLSVDTMRCIVAHTPYAELIVMLLNAYFSTDPEPVGNEWHGDHQAISYLRSRGYRLLHDWSWVRPNADHVVTDRDRTAMQYLKDEWDFDGLREPK